MADLEMMAPAGSYEALTAGINAGADAVYFGVDRLNMRSRSRNNFTLEDIGLIVDQCRENGVKSYLTVNTVLFDDDLSEMQITVDAAKKAGISAIIASDISVLQYASRTGVPVHISTQCNITNIESVRFFAQWSDVMVLARELSLDQVKAIADKIRDEGITGPSGELVRLEIFIHGALCMAVSGKCYLSLHTQNASANRGACIQNCRRPYAVKDLKSGHQMEVDNEYIMSAADLCTIDFLDNVVESGARVFKIEGRGRSADYVHTVVNCYRKALNALSNGTYTSEKAARWKEELRTVYNRDFWDGYYLGRTMGEWSTVHGSKATKRKQFLGPCKKYYPNHGVGAFQIQTGELSEGDEVLVTGPTTGVLIFKASELRLDDQPVTSVKKGDLFSTPVPEKVRNSDKLYKLESI